MGWILASAYYYVRIQSIKNPSKYIGSRDVSLKIIGCSEESSTCFSFTESVPRMYQVMGLVDVGCSQNRSDLGRCPQNVLILVGGHHNVLILVRDHQNVLVL